MDSLLQIHGAFILASREGLEARDAEQRYTRTRREEDEYRTAAVDFAQSFQGEAAVVDPKVATAALEAASEIGKGTNFERSGTVATGILRNLTVAVATAASLGALPVAAAATGSTALTALATAAALLATEGLKKSQSFSTLTTLVTQGIDRASKAELAGALAKLQKLFGPQVAYFRSAKKSLGALLNGVNILNGELERFGGSNNERELVRMSREMMTARRRQAFIAGGK